MHRQTSSKGRLSGRRFRSRRETCSLFGSALREIQKIEIGPSALFCDEAFASKDKDDTAHLLSFGYIGMTGITKTQTCSH